MNNIELCLSSAPFKKNDCDRLIFVKLRLRLAVIWNLLSVFSSISLVVTLRERYHCDKRSLTVVASELGEFHTALRIRDLRSIICCSVDS